MLLSDQSRLLADSTGRRNYCSRRISGTKKCNRWLNTRFSHNNLSRDFSTRGVYGWENPEGHGAECTFAFTRASSHRRSPNTPEIGNCPAQPDNSPRRKKKQEAKLNPVAAFLSFIPCEGDEVGHEISNDAIYQNCFCGGFTSWITFKQEGEGTVTILLNGYPIQNSLRTVAEPSTIQRTTDEGVHVCPYYTSLIHSTRWNGNLSLQVNIYQRVPFQKRFPWEHHELFKVVFRGPLY